MASTTSLHSLEDQLPPHSENVDEELHRVRLALEAIFSPRQQPSEPEWWAQRQLADRYLTSFQGTAVSWMVCDRLLQEGDSPQDRVVQQQRRFFAAQTLHTKCRTDMHELPVDSLSSLRDSLLQHLTRYVAIVDEALTTRLAMCISALAVQMGWTTIVTDLLANCDEANNTNRTVAMIVLRSLPEECASDRLLLADDAPRYEMRDHLVSSAPLMFSFLLASMQEGAAARVLETFHIWIRYVPIRPEALAESPLLPCAVHAMTQPEYLEVAADVLVEVLRMYPSHHHGNDGLVRRMIPALAQLPLDEALRSQDEDVIRAYCRVVTEMGESYMSLILFAQHQPIQMTEASQLVEGVLQCSQIPNPEIAGITLHFWYRLVMDLEELEPFEWRQEVIDCYSSHLQKLIEVCVTHLMRLPMDLDEVADDKVEDLHKHRSYVDETIEDCCRLLGGQSVLQQIGRLMRGEVEKVAGRQQAEWQGLESCLACIGAVHRFVPNDEGETLPMCFNLIPQLPPDIQPLRQTASKMIGKYSSWLAAHPGLLQPLLPYLAQGLSVPECTSAAAVAIKELCCCSNQNFAIAEPVLQLYEELMSRPVGMHLKDEIQILEGVCRALSRTIQDTRDDGKLSLKRLAQPVGNRLASIVTDLNASPTRIIPEIDRLTVIVQFLTVPISDQNIHPMIELLQSSWALLETAMNRFSGDIMLAETICRLHKHALRNLGAKAYLPMLDALMKHLVTSFERSHQSPFLYAASICITEYSHDPTYSQRLFDMVAAMATVFFSFNRSLLELTEQPDVAEEFFYLMGRMISYCPDPVVKSPLLKSVAQCAVVGMQLEHHGANKGTLKFLENTISYGLELRQQNKPDSQAALEQVLLQEGQAIVTNLAGTMTGDLPSYSNQAPELLWKMNLLCPGLLTQWLTSAFATTSGVPERAKIDFMSVLDTGLARDEFSLAVRAFQTACDRERRCRQAQRRP